MSVETADAAALGGDPDEVKRGIVARVLLAMLDFYQKGISPLTPPSCRFQPTCSNYAVEAIQKRGPVVGVLLAMWRLLKCGPWHPGGWDPVPERKHRRRTGDDPGGREPPDGDCHGRP